MTKVSQTALRFKNGRLTKATPPSWFRLATSADGNLQDALTQAGARALDEIGDGGDQIEIGRAHV